jgi:SAM-dependent MidA family methyltransferase
VSAAEAIAARIREHGPLTVAAFMELALYDPEVGYYARAAQRSGRAGDFFTSVDVGPLFGALVGVQVAEMVDALGAAPPPDGRAAALPCDLVEAGAGNGRLAADLLRQLREHRHDVYERLRVHLIESSAAARAAQAPVLGEDAGRLVWSRAELPGDFEGVLVANELLDAMPVHQVVMRETGLREVYVDLNQAGALITREDLPSTPALAARLDEAGAVLEPGWRTEVGLAAASWVREAARRLRRGFMILIDYGHPARELYSVTHASGTLTSFSGHTAAGAKTAGTPGWLRAPGEQDITAHVDFTGIQTAAEAEGMITLGFTDQTYFVMGLCGFTADAAAPTPAMPINGLTPARLKTLLMPGGLGSTMKVLVLGKQVGAPHLSGCAYRLRVT